ncbi:MAG: pectin acetylesterase-family hydrolase, partial [Rhizobiaceae bacterium]
MASVDLVDICKKFGPVVSVDKQSLSVKDGEFMVFLGPSGCGKTTTMRMIAGLVEPTEGSVLIGGQDVTYDQPRERDVAMVFQNYGLYPHMTVADNIAYPLKVRGVAKADRDRQVREVAAKVELAPLLDRRLEFNPIRAWNMVFMPYCTGDVHTGNAVTTYVDPLGKEPDLEFHHAGHANNQAAIAWMREQFPTIDRLFVTGCSAGGAGTLANYYFLRTGLEPQRGYMLDDSGPIFPDSVNSKPLHDQIRSAWDIDSILETVPAFAELGEDFGLINEMVADTFPDDRLATTFFRRDYDFSRYSYERFFPGITKDEIHEKWWADTQNLMAQYETRDNLAYFIPYWRYANHSHCSIILTWDGTEIEEAGGIDMGGFIDILLDDSQALQSF